MSNQRFFYYAGWCITDGSVIASGLGYGGQDPKTKHHRFDHIYSINIYEVEFGLSPQIMMQVDYIVILYTLVLEPYDSLMAQVLRVQ